MRRAARSIPALTALLSAACPASTPVLGGGEEPPPAPTAGAPLISAASAVPSPTEGALSAMLPLGSLFVPASLRGTAAPVDVVLHLHGAERVVRRLVSEEGVQAALVTVQAGSGSQSYRALFEDPAAFEELFADVLYALRRSKFVAEPEVGRIAVTAFSAGYGAARALSEVARHFERIDALLLADGLHADYAPRSGRPERRHYEAFLRFAQAARRGDKLLVITHSEIVPPGYASTTEVADALLARLGLRRRAVPPPRGHDPTVDARAPEAHILKSEVHAGGFHLYGYGGVGPDNHMRHLRDAPALAARLLRERWGSQPR